MNAAEKELFIYSKLKKTQAFLNEVNTLVHFGYFETATNRCYYCCFYCAQALLSAVDLYPKSHRGVLTQFNLHYAKTGKFPLTEAAFLQEIFTQRQLADYSDGHEITQEMAEAFLANTQLFFEMAKGLLEK